MSWSMRLRSGVTRLSFLERFGKKDGEAFPIEGQSANATSGRNGISGLGDVEMCQGEELWQNQRSSGETPFTRGASYRELPRSGFVQLRLCGRVAYVALSSSGSANRIPWPFPAPH